MRFSYAIAILLMLFLVQMIPAQNAGKLEQVDRTVSDVDPLQVSFRALGHQLAVHGQRNSIFESKDGEQYYYLRPGVTAKFDRSVYLWVPVNSAGQDQLQLMQAIGPNTVFLQGKPNTKQESKNNLAEEQAAFIAFEKAYARLIQGRIALLASNRTLDPSKIKSSPFENIQKQLHQSNLNLVAALVETSEK